MDTIEEKKRDLDKRLAEVRQREAKAQQDKQADQRKADDLRREQDRKIQDQKALDQRRADDRKVQTQRKRTEEQRLREAKATREKLDRYAKQREEQLQTRRQQQQERREADLRRKDQDRRDPLDKQARQEQEDQQESQQEGLSRTAPISKQAQERGLEKERQFGVVEGVEMGHTTDMKNVLDGRDDIERERMGQSGPREMTERELDLERRHHAQSQENIRAREQSTQENLARQRDGKPVGQARLQAEGLQDNVAGKSADQAKASNFRSVKTPEQKKAAAALRGKASGERLSSVKEQVAARKEQQQDRGLDQQHMRR